MSDIYFPDDDDLEPEEDWKPEEPQFTSELARLIYEEYGVVDYEGVIVDIESVNLSDLRGQRFDTLEEAVLWLLQIGLFAFSHVTQIEDVFGVEVPPCSNPPC